MPAAIRFAVFALCLALTTGARAEAMLDRPAPKVDTPLVDGKLLRASDLKGKVVLTVFWATWCPTCVEEMPELQRLYDTYRGRGVEILALSLDEETQEVADFWKAKGYTYPVAMRTEKLKKAWGRVIATPQMFLIDRKGVVRLKHVGPMGYEKLEAKLKPLL